MSNAGAPRKHDREALLQAFLSYIEETRVPIVSEFAYQNGLHRQQLYDMPELSDALKLCITKKEANLEKGGLAGELNVTMSIFSLKQMGWRDTGPQDQAMGPQDAAERKSKLMEKIAKVIDDAGT